MDLHNIFLLILDFIANVLLAFSWSLLFALPCSQYACSYINTAPEQYDICSSIHHYALHMNSTQQMVFQYYHPTMAPLPFHKSMASNVHIVFCCFISCNLETLWSMGWHGSGVRLCLGQAGRIGSLADSHGWQTWKTGLLADRQPHHWPLPA